MRRILLTSIILCLAINPAPSLGQAAPRVEVRGYIRDAATDDPLPGANVFIDGTTLGAAADTSGFFTIENVPAINLKLVASMIGFQRQVYELNLTEGDPTEIVFKLKPEVHAISGITVTSKPDDKWKRNLERFKKLFIGTMDAAKEVEILNPEVLDFSYENERLYASARAPLRIVNRALGYQIVYHLDTLWGNVWQSFYRGTSQFTELMPADTGQVQQWHKNRRNAYRGSLRHFLTALAKDSLQQAGFIASRDRVAGRRSHKVQYGVRDTLVDPGRRPYEYVLSVPDALTVGYDQGESPGYTNHRRRIGYHPESWDNMWIEFSKQYSWLLIDGGTATFTARGILFNSNDVTRLGYWAWEEKIATLLPLDYVYTPAPGDEEDPWWEYW